MGELANQVYKRSTADDARTESLPERPYNINRQYFLHIDQTVPFDLDQVYFTQSITEDGIYFKIVKDTKNRDRVQVSQQAGELGG